MKPKKHLPKFKSEAEEPRFWATHDSTEYLDWSKTKRVLFPNLKPSVKTISIRLPESLLDALKTLANERDVPYQSLVKMIPPDLTSKILLSIALIVVFAASIGAEDHSGGKPMGLFGKKEVGSERPAESFSILQSEVDGRPLIAMINMAYKTFKSKSAYPWVPQYLYPPDTSN